MSNCRHHHTAVSLPNCSISYFGLICSIAYQEACQRSRQLRTAMITCVHKDLYSSTTLSQCSCGCMPRALAASAIFSPCSSVPVTNLTSLPCRRCTDNASVGMHMLGVVSLSCVKGGVGTEEIKSCLKPCSSISCYGWVCTAHVWTCSGKQGKLHLTMHTLHARCATGSHLH